MATCFSDFVASVAVSEIFCLLRIKETMKFFPLASITAGVTALYLVALLCPVSHKNSDQVSHNNRIAHSCKRAGKACIILKVSKTATGIGYRMESPVTRKRKLRTFSIKRRVSKVELKISLSCLYLKYNKL